jgi:Mce-associated membrane protein
MAESKNNGTSASPNRPKIATGGLNSTATEHAEERSAADVAAPGAAAEALALAEQADAEAAEAEALAAVARARARAIRLRRQAQARTTEAPDESDQSKPDNGGEDETASVTATEVLPATSPDEQNADADPEPPADEAPRWWRRRPDRRVRARVALGITFVLICALLAASGYLVWHHRSAVAERHRTAEFAAAARQGVVSLMTMDFNHAKDDVQRVLDNSTGQFRDDFQSRADDFTKVVQESKVVTKATVNATAVQSKADSNSAVVLVSATSEVSNATGAQNQPRAWRLSVTVTRDGGQIKMSRVEFVP